MISVTGELSSALATLYFKSSVSVSSLTLINFIGSDPLEFLLKVNFAPASPVLTLSFFAYLNTGISNVFVVVVECVVSVPFPYFNHVSFLFPALPTIAFSFNVAE